MLCSLKLNNDTTVVRGAEATILNEKHHFFLFHLCLCSFIIPAADLSNSSSAVKLVDSFTFILGIFI